VTGAGVVLFVVVAVAVVFVALPQSAPTTVSTVPRVSTPSAATTTASDAAKETTTTAGTESEDFLSYADPQGRFTMEYPASWTNTSQTKLASGSEDTYLAVGFADQSGPTQDGRFLDCFGVSATDSGLWDESRLPIVKQGMEQMLEETPPPEVTELKVLEPLRGVQIGDIPGYTVTLGYSYQGRSRVKIEYQFIAGKDLCVARFLAAEEDFEKLEPVFEEIVQSMRF
jgi:hypothetical protein